MPFSQYRLLSREEQDKLEANYTIDLMKCWRAHSEGHLTMKKHIERFNAFYALIGGYVPRKEGYAFNY
jgi:hypothetical protein